MRLLLTCFLLVIFIPSLAALPPSAQAYLNKIPGQKLSLPFIIKVALENAEAYRDLGLQYASAELVEDKVRSFEDTVLAGAANYIDDNSIKTSPFQPPRIQSWNWEFGLNKIGLQVQVHQ